MQIIDFIDNQNLPKMPVQALSTPIKLPKYWITEEELKKDYQDMEDPDFWLQQAIKKETTTGAQTKLEDANVFYR